MSTNALTCSTLTASGNGSIGGNQLSIGNAYFYNNPETYGGLVMTGPYQNGWSGLNVQNQIYMMTDTSGNGGIWCRATNTWLTYSGYERVGNGNGSVNYANVSGSTNGYASGGSAWAYGLNGNPNVSVNSLTAVGGYNPGWGYGSYYTATPTGNAVAWGVVCNYRVIATEYDSTSDERIKENIEPIGEDVVDKIMDGVVPKTYTLIDTRANGTSSRLGFIAQDVEAIPGLSIVTTSKGNVPSAYKMGDRNGLHDIARIPDVPFDVHILGVDEGFVSAVHVGKTVLTCQDDAGAMYIGTVNCIATSTSLVVTLDKTFPETLQQIFVFGEQVDDLRALDHKQLFTACFAATQRLRTQMVAMQSQVDALVTEMAAMRSAMPSG